MSKKIPVEIESIYKSDFMDTLLLGFMIRVKQENQATLEQGFDDFLNYLGIEFAEIELDSMRRNFYRKHEQLKKAIPKIKGGVFL